MYEIEGKLYAKQLGCTDCSVDSICKRCRECAPVKHDYTSNDEDDDSETIEHQDEEDGGRTDLESEDDEGKYCLFCCCQKGNI